MSDNPRDSEPKFNPRAYWWVAGTTLFWLILLYWFTETFNIPFGGA